MHSKPGESKHKKLFQSTQMHGGDIIAEVLRAQGVKFIFTLCGGHISPILIGCKKQGIRVIDVRHEVTAVFAADAVARLTGIPGVAAVTAGPGATNTITAVKNARLAQSPLILLGGATATALKGRGSLQDIDQLALFKPHVKCAKTVKKVRNLIPTLETAFRISQAGVPGPVFVECPIDLLYEESLVREWYGVNSNSRSLADRALKFYLKHHLNRLFAGANPTPSSLPIPIKPHLPQKAQVKKIARKLQQAKRPVLIVGSQAMLATKSALQVASAVEKLGIPVYFSGMARGLLGKGHPLQMRHKRRQALKEADVVVLAGVPCDFRLDYGRHIPRGTLLISANRSRKDLKLNRRPNLGVLGDPGRFLVDLSPELSKQKSWNNWLEKLRRRDDDRVKEICQKSSEETDLINPLHLCVGIENALADNSVLVADGGDFVATASYTVSPRAPLSWLDPGVFGTLGVGAGFAIGAKLCRPEAEVWILYGDGSVGYSLSEFDTFVRHKIPVLAVVGNDASWAQIAREQLEIFKDDVGTVLRHTDYHVAAQAFGGKGFLLTESKQISEVFAQAKKEVA
ncbi:MAG: thiamine pyrophosphate-binding protein, partial [bacterium]